MVPNVFKSHTWNHSFWEVFPIRGGEKDYHGKYDKFWQLLSKTKWNDSASAKMIANIAQKWLNPASGGPFSGTSSSRNQKSHSERRSPMTHVIVWVGSSSGPMLRARIWNIRKLTVQKSEDKPWRFSVERKFGIDGIWSDDCIAPPRLETHPPRTLSPWLHMQESAALLYSCWHLMTSHSGEPWCH